MLDLTVVILTKNEEKNIEKCIASFKGIVKRFVIVDSYSDDHTKKICFRLNEELSKNGSRLDFYENPWVDYATQFNWAIENTKIDTTWTMRMDADEELLPLLAHEISEKLNTISHEVNGIILKRRLVFMGKWIRHGGRYPERLLRIWRTGFGKCEQKVMDEHIVLSEGKTIAFINDLQDNNQKDLNWWIHKHNWYSNREVLDHQLTLEKKSEDLLWNTSKQASRKRKIKNKRYYKLPKFFRAHLYFIYRYYIRLGFLDGKEGKIFHFLQAYWYRFLVDSKLYECEKNGTMMETQGDLKL